MASVERQFCLDMMNASWVGTSGLKQSDCAIILEIEATGGLIQTTVAIPTNADITLDTEEGSVQGHVVSCEQDPYGYNVNFAVNPQATNWFPFYTPALLHSSSRG